MTVEEAMRLLISGGVIAPPDPPKTQRPPQTQRPVGAVGASHAPAVVAPEPAASAAAS